VRSQDIERLPSKLIFEILDVLLLSHQQYINLVSATKYTPFGHRILIFMKDLVDCSATTHGVISPNTVASDYEAAVDMLLDIAFLRFRS